MKNTKYASAISNRAVGNLGEDLSCTFLMKHGFVIIERNYLRKWGEIDIIAEKGGILHFIEVKTVNRPSSKARKGSVIHETGDTYRPEDNLSPRKLQKMKRAVASYLLDRHTPMNKAWKCDAITVILDTKTRIARMSFIKDIM